MPTIKINRALQLASVGRFPASAQAMLDHVPESVIAALSAARLAEMLDSMWVACQEAKSIVAADACKDGALWDAKAMRLRELARVEQ